jgi:glycosyltransferase involved in cell wall biosynthesis
MTTDKGKTFPKIILVFLPVDWPLFMRRKMVVALAQAAKPVGAKVIAVNRPLCPVSTAFRKPKRIPEFFGKTRLDQLGDNLYLFSPRYFIHDSIAAGSSLLERLNVMALRRSYLHLCRRIGVPEDHPVIWFYHPRQGYVTNLFHDSFNVFEIKDSFSDVHGNESEAMAARERALRDRVDLLLCTSAKLMERYSQGYRSAWLSGNGLDRLTYDELTAGTSRPIPEIAGIAKPRIGYTGLISTRLDWNLILELARRKPDWNLVFVGKIYGSSIKARARQQGNIHFVGWYDHQLMPAVLRSFHIGIMPYRDNEFFRYSNPLKFYEFAAAGLRTVSSNMEELGKFPDELVKIVPNQVEEWIEAIQSFLDRDPDEARRIGADVAARHIWEDMADKLIGKLSEHLK